MSAKFTPGPWSCQLVKITDPFGCVLTLYDGAHPTMTGAIRQLLADLAAVSAERDLLAREISEADDLARHFVRDRPTLRARGAIVLQADEIGKLRAQLAEYENAPTVAYLATPVSGDYAGYHGDSVGMTPGSAIMDAKTRFYAEFNAVELIARPKVKK